jgi:hypothetical protein
MCDAKRYLIGNLSDYIKLWLCFYSKLLIHVLIEYYLLLLLLLYAILWCSKLCLSTTCKIDVNLLLQIMDSYNFVYVF